MLKKMINHAYIDLEIIPIDPLFIKSGQASVSGVDMAFVSTDGFGKEKKPFIPGSSLKGMIRSYAEKICRSLRDEPVPVCLPYLNPNQAGDVGQASCGLRLKDKKNLDSSEIYRVSCPACRLFGSHKFIGRFATSDAYLTEDYKKNYRIEIRDGVAIDRLTGGAAPGAKYDLEVLTRGEFETSLEIRNFERWQLGLTGLVLRDMEEGLVRGGFGKSRGLGSFKAKIKNFKITYYHREVSHLTGLAKLCTDDERTAYGFFPEKNKTSPLPEPEINGLRYEHNITDNWKEILEPGVNDLIEYIQEVKFPQALEQLLEGRH